MECVHKVVVYDDSNYMGGEGLSRRIIGKLPSKTDSDTPGKLVFRTGF
jgi:hypothetical protein